MMGIKRILLILVFIGFTLTLGAAVTEVSIPNEGWSINFNSPTITKYEGSSEENNFHYMGTSDNGFIISIFVEPIKGSAPGIESCKNYYWNLAKRNPMIDKETINVKNYKDFIRVEYRIKGEEKGIKFNILNANFYSEYNKKWIDVHISKYPSNKEDNPIFEEFTKSLCFKHFDK